MKKKLPKSLSTVTTFSKTLAVLLFFLFLLGFFRLGMKYQKSIDNYQQNYPPSPISSAPVISAVPTTEVSPNISSSPIAGKTVVITSQDEGKVIDARVGDRVVVQLSDTMNWSNVRLSSTNILQPSPDGVFYIHAVQGRYKAVAPGTVDISATGGPICNAGKMCPQYLVLFKTTIAVSQ